MVRWMNDLKRIANALEHLAHSPISHGPKNCQICAAKTKPIKKMPMSVVQTSERLALREAQIRQSKLLHGPEQPVGDMFRYRELKS